METQKNTRTNYIQIRLSDEEKEKLRQLADEQHLSISGYARSKLLSAK